MVQVFISYSHKDTELVSAVASTLSAMGITPYVAAYDTPSGRSLTQKIQEEVRKSQSILVLWTTNVAEDPDTSQSVVWEVSAAHSSGKQIYVFRESGTSIPLFVSQSTDYFTYDPQEDMEIVFSRMQEIAAKLKKAESTKNAILLIGAALVGAWFLFGGE